MLDITGDSLHHKKLISREKYGKVNNRKRLVLNLEDATNLKLDTEKPIVIIFYPGKDACNTNGTADKLWLEKWYKKLEEGLLQVADVKPLYIYKNKEGLEKYNGVVKWYKDPESIIEKLFFEHHYPCKSFVVISKEGNYISYLGEFVQNQVWEAAEIMNK